MQNPPVVQPPPGRQPPPPKSNTLRNVFLGCGCLMVLMFVSVVGVVWYIAANAKGIAADVAGSFMVQAIKDSKLPQDQKDRLTNRITQLKDDVKSDKITLEQLGKIAESLGKSPLIPAGTVYFIDEQYLKKSGLDDEEKERGKRSVQRVTRGMISKRISEAELQTVLAAISEPDPSHAGKTKLKDKVTDEELREFIDRAEALADEKDIEDEPFEINIADEFDKAIDEALKGNPTP